MAKKNKNEDPRLLKKQLLIDFNTNRWKTVDMESVKEEMIYLKMNAKQGRLLGQLGHPDKKKGESIGMLSINNASHTIIDINLDEEVKCIYGDIKILNSPPGNTMMELLEIMKKSGIEPVFGMRASGSTVDGKTVIDKIFTWDLLPPNTLLKDK